MIRRIVSLIVLLWLLGLAWFMVMLPAPSDVARTDAVIVLTGAPGRFQRGLQVLEAGRARRMLVSGVDRSVRRSEFEIAQNVPKELSRCCIDLGKDAVDTVTNAREAAVWVQRHHFKSVRLVTTDWHMRRARFEFERAFGDKVVVIGDAVKSNPGLTILVKEYNKLIARRVAALFGF